MAINGYTKTTYVDNTTPAINAANLNNIEAQVKAISDAAVNGGASPTKLWTDTNDGTGSGLDADMLDGAHADQLVAFRNKFVNGNFDIWQEGISATVSTAGTALKYLADQWYCETAGTGASAVYSRQTFTPGQTDVPGNPTYRARVAISNGGDATNGAVLLEQPMENVRTFAGKQVTQSKWIYADAPKNISLEIRQRFGSGGSPSSEVSTFVEKRAIPAGWSYQTFTYNVPSIAGKTIGTDGPHTSSLVVQIWLSAGSAYNSRTGSLGIQTGTFDFARMKIEEGAVATAFEEIPIAVELVRCQRFYEKSYNQEDAPGTVTSVGSIAFTGASDGSNNIALYLNFSATKRKIPTMTGYVGATANIWNYSRSGASGTGTPVFTSVGTGGGFAYLSIGAAWTAGIISGHWIADARF